MELHWTKNRPTVPGAYWVRGYWLGRPNKAALVEVRYLDGELCSNLHCTNSDDDNDGFDTLANHSDKFEWCGPLVPANAEGERRP